MPRKRIEIKPLSVNNAWQGRRFKTPKYKSFEKELLLKLPTKIEHFDKMDIDITIGVCKLFDIDNCIKPFLDVLQKKYGFNDRNIYLLSVKKEVVKKGSEFIEFNIKRA